MTVIVLILNYCSSSLSIKLTQIIRQYNNVTRVVIVDNDSPDDSFDVLSSRFNRFEDVDVIETSTNGGYSFGNNFGLNYINNHYSPDIVIIANPDTDIEEKDLSIILKDLNSHSKLAIQTGVIYNIFGEKVSNQLWWSPSYTDMLLNQTLVTYKIRKLLQISNYSKPYKLSKDIICAEAVPGCFFAIKMKAINGINIFDNEFFLFSEENVISYNLHKNRLLAGVSLNAKVRHNHTYKPEMGKFISNRLPLLRSYTLFIRKYLQKKWYQISWFKFVFWFGEIERKLIETIKHKGK